MEKVLIVYSSKTCCRCKDLKRYLDEKDITYEERDVKDPQNLAVLRRMKCLSLPVVVYGVAVVEGFDEEKINTIIESMEGK